MQPPPAAPEAEAPATLPAEGPPEQEPLPEASAEELRAAAGVPDVMQPPPAEVDEERPIPAEEPLVEGLVREEGSLSSDTGHGADPAALPRLKTILESLMFAAGGPVPSANLLAIVREVQADLSLRGLREVVELLRQDLREQGRGVRVVEVGGGFQLRTPSETAPYVRLLITRRPPRLTRPTLETLAIVAYRQPVTRGEIEEVRGVDSGAVLKHLLDRRLVKILWRKDEPGRPLLYGTTREFLELFSLKDLKSLPTLQDFVELSDEHRASLGLPPAQRGEVDEAGPPGADFLVPDDTAAFTPVGDDEVVQELAEVLDELRQKDRKLRSVLPAPKGPDPAAAPEASTATAPAEPVVPAEPAAAPDDPDESGREEL
jgi:segregation and condensation protein B